jgi:precorrin-3B C17-methyltransferase
VQRNYHRHGQGKLFVVGIGPGNPLDRTHRAEDAIRRAGIVVGYSTYLDKISDLIDGQEIVSSGMRKEKERARSAVEAAIEGRTVALVSSGDAGVYGMAGLALEIIHAEKVALDVEIVPGITAASVAAARLGAPLMLDFAALSLSDLLVSWEEIESRLQALAPLDMAVCLYNPKSKRRTRQIETAADILRDHRAGTVPVGICTAMGTAEERTVLSDLDSFLEEEISMKSVVVVGSQRTKILGSFMVTFRGYVL